MSVPSSVKAERLSEVYFLHCLHQGVLFALSHKITLPTLMEGGYYHCLCFGNGRNGGSGYVNGLHKSIQPDSNQSQSDQITVLCWQFSPSSVSGLRIHFAK